MFDMLGGFSIVLCKVHICDFLFASLHTKLAFFGFFFLHKKVMWVLIRRVLVRRV